MTDIRQKLKTRMVDVHLEVMEIWYHQRPCKQSVRQDYNRISEQAGRVLVMGRVTPCNSKKLDKTQLTCIQEYDPKPQTMYHHSPFCNILSTQIDGML